MLAYGRLGEVKMLDQVADSMRSGRKVLQDNQAARVRECLKEMRIDARRDAVRRAGINHRHEAIISLISDLRKGPAQLDAHRAKTGLSAPKTTLAMTTTIMMITNRAPASAKADSLVAHEYLGICGYAVDTYFEV